MSVIVKGMRMPDSCISCPLLEYDEFAIDGYKDHWCNALDIGMSLDDMPEGRRKDCPLTELILCKYCEHYVIDQLKKDGTEDKRYSPSVCLFRISRNSPDWYCADAERKKNDGQR